MAGDWTINWKGPEVLKVTNEATKAGIDEIMNRCVPDAMADVPYATGALQGSIKVVEYAREDGREIAGIWGSTDIFYALGVETGDYGYLKGFSQDKESTAGFKRPTTKRNKGRRGSLRKAADKHYPDLPKAIARGIE